MTTADDSSEKPHEAETNPHNALGIAAFIASMSSLLGFAFIGPIAGIIMGGMARKRSREDGLSDNKFGRWGVTWGIIFLIVNVVVTAVVVGILIMSFAQDPYGAPGPNAPAN